MTASMPVRGGGTQRRHSTGVVDRHQRESSLRLQRFGARLSTNISGVITLARERAATARRRCILGFHRALERLVISRTFTISHVTHSCAPTDRVIALLSTPFSNVTK